MAESAALNEYDSHILGVHKKVTQYFEIKNGVSYHRIDIDYYSPLKKNFFYKILSNKLKKSVLKIYLFYLKFKKYFFYKTNFIDVLLSLKPDIIHANDLICLPLAIKAKKKLNCKVVYDAHELETNRNPPLFFFLKFYVYLLENYGAKRSDFIITVGNEISKILSKRLGGKRIEVIYNSPLLLKSKSDIKTDLGLKKFDTLIVCVGNITVNRGIENVLHIVKDIADVYFVALGNCEEKIHKKLVYLAKKLGLEDRFFFLPPVPHSEVVKYISTADIGVLPVVGICLSYKLAMPNKFFEMSFANIPILSNDLKEISHTISILGNGIITDMSNASISAYNLSKLIHYKKNYLLDVEKKKYLYEKFSWKSQEIKLINIYKSILEAPSS